MILIRGLPGSSKSTLAGDMSFAYPFSEHFEADMYFIDSDGNYNFDASKLRQAHKWCQEQTDRVLAEGEMVVVSNTFTTKKELKPYFELAKKYNIIPTVILCQNNFGSIHNVPEETIEKMKQRFQYDISELFEVL
jgi:predicted kinase